MTRGASILVPVETPELCRERTAVHEAGHAVVAVVLGLAIEEVSIKPEGRTSGHVYLDYETNPWARVPRKKVAIVLLAGGEAERVLCGNVPEGYVPANDLREAERALKGSTPPTFRWCRPLGRMEWMRTLHTAAGLLVTEHKDAVRRVADALLERETLSGDDVRGMV